MAQCTDIIDSGGAESVKLQCSKYHTQFSWRQVAYIREFEVAQLCICGLRKMQWDRLKKIDLIWFRQLSIIFSIMMIDDYRLWMLFGSVFDPHKLLITWCISDWWWCLDTSYWYMQWSDLAVNRWNRFRGSICFE